MPYKTIEVLCKDCHNRDEKFVSYPDEWDLDWACSKCNGLSRRTISAPHLRTSESASYLDGTDRGSTFNQMKAAAKLKVDALDIPPAQRGEIKAEIRKLGAGTDDL